MEFAFNCVCSALLAAVVFQLLRPRRTVAVATAAHRAVELRQNAQNQAVNTVGPALLTTSLATVGSYNATGGYTTLQFDNLGLNLAANTKYIAMPA
ncbi:hypothetical protein ACFJGW_12300 [Burkholderiaceae bacterium UC74_6]